MRETKAKKSMKAGRKISLSLKKYYSNPIARKKLSKLIKKRYSSSIARKKMSESVKEYYSNPKVREKSSRKRKKYWREHPKMRRRCAELSRRAHSTPAYKRRMSRIKKEQYRENPSLVKKIDRTMTKWWKEHPNVRKNKSIEMKNFFIKHPEKFKKFLKYGSNPTLLSFKTKQGFLVRSKGEQKIANFLFENKIKSLYEGKTLTFEKEGLICIPDFYLPSSKVYIEFYGGFPRAWKKKVIKNRIYRKHKIPCIFITPAELRDLNYYLLGKLKK